MSCCVKEASVSYSIKNASSFPIKVTYVNNHSNNTAGSSVVIYVGSEVTLAVINKGKFRVSRFKEKDEQLSDFSKIDILLNNSVNSKTNFLKTSCWVYEKQEKRQANYLLTVTDADF